MHLSAPLPGRNPSRAAHSVEAELDGFGDFMAALGTAGK